MHGRKVQRKRHLIVFIELGTADMAWRRPANDDDSRVIDIVIAAGSASSAAAAAAAKPAARPGPARPLSIAHGVSLLAQRQCSAADGDDDDGTRECSDSAGGGGRGLQAAQTDGRAV